MRVLLIPFDGKMPNLALMKLSTYHQARGDTVGLHIENPDKIYVSVIFSWNRETAFGIKKMYPDTEIIFGGSGIDLKNKLPDEIEYLRPDYDLYGIDYSIGFTSRGCPKHCPFCIVHDKEGDIRHSQYIWEFLGEDHKKVVLFDNNFLAAPYWKENLQYIIDNNLKVNFNQGLDLQYITKENAEMLRKIKYYNWHFSGRQLHFAWDLMSSERYVRKGLKILLDAGISKSHIMIYMLVGFNTTFREDYYRYKVLWEEYGVYPFVMVYNRKGNPITKKFARWVNKRIHKVCKFTEYENLTNKERIKVKMLMEE